MTDLDWSLETPHGDDVWGLDPYATWALRYGRAFDATARARRESPGDYAYQAVLETRAAPDAEGVSREPTLPEEAIPVVPLRAGVLSPGSARSAALYLTELDGSAPPPSEPDGEEEVDDTVINRARFRAPLRSLSVAPPGPLTAPDYKAQKLDPKRAVIVGVIDDAINPLNARFHAPDGGVRVDFAWAQDADIVAKGTVPFGRAYDRAELEGALGPKGGLTEEGRLARLGLIDVEAPGPHPLARRLSHGTHVADLAAGFPSAKAPRDLRMITVSLPGRVTLETSGGTLTPFLVAALDHIFDRAFLMSTREGFPIPVVVNFSYALTGGPHNGLHMIETAIDALTASYLARLKTKFGEADRQWAKVVLPAGNSYLDRGHAVAFAPEEGGATQLDVTWRTVPGDVTENLLELWMPRDAEHVALQITPPGGTATTLRGLLDGRALVLHPSGKPDQVVGRAALVRQGGRTSPSSPRLQSIVLALAPSDTTPGISHPKAPPGKWQITLSADLRAGETLRAWVQRDEPPAGYARPGRASWLEHPEYRLFNAEGDLEEQDQPGSAVRRLGSLSGIATTAPDVDPKDRARVTVGGWTGRDLAFGPKPVPPDGLRATRIVAAGDAQMGLADLSAQTGESRVLDGIQAAGTASGSVVRMAGSSVAAPQETRRIALSWLAGDSPDTPSTPSHPPDRLHPLDPPDPRLGGGLLVTS